MISFSQLLSVTGFVACIGLVFYLVVRWVVRRLLRRVPTTRLERLLDRSGWLFILLALVGVGCIAYGRWVEPNYLTVTTYRIETPKIPAGEHVRIVQLADLHVRAKGPREKALPGLVRSLIPDVIVHTGDFFGKGGGFEPIVVDMLKSWDCPQYAVQGNLDVLGDYRGVIRDAGIHNLDRTKAIVTVRGARICIDGFSELSQWDMPEALGKLSDDTYNIVLFHRPSGFMLMEGTKADLMVSGHTHGGQVRLPWYGALVTMDSTGKRWEYGLYDEGGKKLIVSRGIGCEPLTPEVRFLCPPEVVVIDLIGIGEKADHPAAS